MTRVMLRADALGELALERVVIEYDGPKLFTARDSAGRLYVSIFIDDDEDGEEFLYVPLSDERGAAFLAGVVSGRDVFRASSEYAWLVNVPFGGQQSFVRRIDAADIHEDWLPADGSRIGLSDDSGDMLTKDFGDSGVLEISVTGLYELASADSDQVSIALSRDGIRIWDPTPVAAVGLLRRLADNWANLIWQEGLTNGVRIGALKSINEELGGFDAEVSSVMGNRRLRSEYQSFLESHDLARIFGVTDSPSVVLVKEGLLGWILTSETAERYSFQELTYPLEELGNLIAGALDSAGRVGASAAAAWRARADYEIRDIVQIVTRMDPEELDLLGPDLDESIWAEAAEEPDRSEILAAARMASGLPPAEVVKVIQLTSEMPFCSVPELDDLSDEIKGRFPVADEVWLHGQQVARWLRERLEFDARDVVDPEKVLEELGVQVVDVDLDSKIDALSAWGPRHGPSVLINASLRKSGLRARRRVTLAHELGHLLFDRDGALPVAEVLSGERYDSTEARVRAFAVEFLLLQRTAYEEYVADQENPKAVVERLTRRYGVSGEVAAWQIRNFGEELSPKAYAILRSYVSKPHLFWRTR